MDVELVLNLTGKSILDLHQVELLRKFIIAVIGAKLLHEHSVLPFL
jgi:hypothetical protein